MRRCLPILLSAAVLAAPAAAHSHKKNGLEIVHPWTQASAKDATSARVFMTVRDAGGGSDRLVSASTPSAEKVELNEAGRGRAAFVVRTGEELSLHGDGPCLVLVGLKRQLAAYDDFKMTLVFEKAGRIAIDVMVEE
ncbi:MAG TPA: copper chaperone PCu(A)C [Hyphomicrobiaceae bacterium]